MIIDCNLGNILNVKPPIKLSKWDYNVGEEINDDRGNILILENVKIPKGLKYKEKGYVYKCQQCDTVYEISEVNFNKKKQFCEVCNKNGKTVHVIKGVNDIATTHPHLVKYFANIEDTYKYSYGSNKKSVLVCENCKTKKEMIINSFVKHGISCDKCGDGKSYSEKLMLNILNQKLLKFKVEYSPNWKELNKRRYDFYIPSINCIIEMHGEQHYEKCFEIYGARTIEEEQENDRQKKQIALDNGIEEENYIVIDARESNLEWIRDNKNGILNSRLNDLFDLSKIDWIQADKFALTNLAKESCQLWNSRKYTVKEISNILNVSSATIRKYLKKCSRLNLCNYNPDGNKRKVKCKTNNLIFDSILKASIYSGAESTNIVKCCNNKRRYAGKDVNGIKLEWEYII